MNVTQLKECQVQNTEQTQNTENKERIKPKDSFPKDWVGNTDLYKLVLHKIMTKQIMPKKQFQSSFKANCECLKRSKLFKN